MAIALLSEDINNVIYLLAQHKKNVANLYNNYYTKFPEHIYWLDLSKSKQKNHEAIQSIYFTVNPNANVVNDSVFRSAAIKTSLDWVDRLIIESKDHSIINALSYSLDLEQSKIEQKYFDIFKSQSRQIQDILPALSLEAQLHIQLLRCELEKIKNQEFSL